MSDLKIEIGKRYWMRYGGVSGVIALVSTPGSFVLSDGVKTFKANGNYTVDGSVNSYDLIREFNPAELSPPLEWKRGVPTEQECRECWIISGRMQDTPCKHENGILIRPGQSDPTHWDETEWHIVLKAAPAEPPKPATQMVTLRKWIEPNGTGEYTWMRDDMNHKAYGYTRTNETKQIEVATCPKSQP